MRPLREACAHAGSGLREDRYATRAGHWHDDRVSRDLTLVETEVIDELAARHGQRLQAGELRRNVTTRGIHLNELVDRIFWLGDVLCRGAQLCEPCLYLEELTG